MSLTPCIIYANVAGDKLGCSQVWQVTCPIDYGSPDQAVLILFGCIMGCVGGQAQADKELGLSAAYLLVPLSHSSLWSGKSFPHASLPSSSTINSRIDLFFFSSSHFLTLIPPKGSFGLSSCSHITARGMLMYIHVLVCNVLFSACRVSLGRSGCVSSLIRLVRVGPSDR